MKILRLSYSIDKKNDIRKTPTRNDFAGKAGAEFEFEKRFLIGDKVSSIQAAIAAGDETNLFFSKYPLPELSSLPYQTIATLRESRPSMNSSHQQRVKS